MSWTDERVDLLKKLWGEGKTAAEIAKVLGDGVTRNAVIGKAHRLKLSTRLSPIQQNTRPVRHVASEAPRAKRVAVARPDFKGKCVKLVDLTPNMCRWPNGDPQDEDFSFCGCEVVEGLPYCAEHARQAYQIVSKSRHYKAEDFPDEAGTPADFDIKHAAAG
jgi:GcrA cell cycle regulator